VTPCSLLSCNRRFGGTYLLHLQDLRNNFRSYDSGLGLPLAQWFNPPSRWEPSSIFHWPSVSYIYSSFLARRLFCLPPAYLLVLAEIISSTLKMEAICSSKTRVATQQTTWRHIPEDDTLQILKFLSYASFIQISSSWEYFNLSKQGIHYNYIILYYNITQSSTSERFFVNRKCSVFDLASLECHRTKDLVKSVAVRRPWHFDDDVCIISPPSMKTYFLTPFNLLLIQTYCVTFVSTITGSLYEGDIQELISDEFPDTSAVTHIL
jgi:hypothetical protein